MEKKHSKWWLESDKDVKAMYKIYKPKNGITLV